MERRRGRRVAAWKVGRVGPRVERRDRKPLTVRDFRRVEGGVKGDKGEGDVAIEWSLMVNGTGAVVFLSLLFDLEDVEEEVAFVVSSSNRAFSFFSTSVERERTALISPPLPSMGRAAIADSRAICSLLSLLVKEISWLATSERERGLRKLETIFRCFFVTG